MDPIFKSQGIFLDFLTIEDGADICVCILTVYVFLFFVHVFLLLSMYS
jgi:hypothetical protein